MTRTELINAVNHTIVREIRNKKTDLELTKSTLFGIP